MFLNRYLAVPVTGLQRSVLFGKGDKVRTTSCLQSSEACRRRRRRRHENRPLETRVLISSRRPADLPKEIRLSHKVARRAKGWVEDWIRRHPSQILRDWMALTRLRIEICPGMAGSKGLSDGAYEESVNRVRLCPRVFQSDEKSVSKKTLIKPYCLTRREIVDTLSHEIEGHFLEALPALLGTRVHQTRRHLLRSFYAKRPGLEERVESILGEYQGGGMTEVPELTQIYRDELHKIPKGQRKKNECSVVNWKYVTSLDELIAFTAQFDALRNKLSAKLSGAKLSGGNVRKRTPLSQEEQFTRIMGASDKLTTHALMVSKHFPKTIEAIRRHREALLT